jgi:hypothetical protein
MKSEALLFILSSLFFGALCSVPGLVFGYFLGKKGIVRANPKWVIAQSMVGIIGGRIFFPKVSIIIVLLLFSAFSLFVYQYDLWRTLSLGKWWWRKIDDIDGKN